MIIYDSEESWEGTPDELADFIQRLGGCVDMENEVAELRALNANRAEALEDEVAELREELAIKHQIIRSQSQQIGSLQRRPSELTDKERQQYIQQAADLAKEVETWKAIADSSARCIEAICSLPYIITS